MSITRSIIALTDSSWLTSPNAKLASPPASRIRVTVSCPDSSLKSATITFAPSRAYESAIARPMPWPAPVTTPTLFSSNPIAVLPGRPSPQPLLPEKGFYGSLCNGAGKGASRHIDKHYLL